MVRGFLAVDDAVCVYDEKAGRVVPAAWWGCFVTIFSLVLFTAFFFFFSVVKSAGFLSVGVLHEARSSHRRG